ncbi:MAG: Thiamine-monophosphate kinase [Verrucomicrobiota bacterium]|jgi:thiamine-monophosphate kinase
MNEFELLARLLQNLPGDPSTLVGPGDDCAVLNLGVTDKSFLLKTDAVVEGIHFTPDTEPQLVGRKALARCLSDIAAMAGTPTHALITLGLPQKPNLAYTEALYSGIKELAATYHVTIAGGETTTSPQHSFVSVSLLGWCPKDQCILRSGAQPGDAIFVTGTLGGSLQSLHHLHFTPRLTEARWLAQHFPVTAMIDISDGLAGDAPHLLNASHCGAELLAKAIPISRAAKLLHPGKPEAALRAALTDGEDFELLFTLPPSHAVPLADAWRKQFPEIRLSCIGRVLQDTQLRMRTRHGLIPLKLHGYQHFTKP